MYLIPFLVPPFTTTLWRCRAALQEDIKRLETAVAAEQARLQKQQQQQGQAEGQQQQQQQQVAGQEQPPGQAAAVGAPGASTTPPAAAAAGGESAAVGGDAGAGLDSLDAFMAGVVTQMEEDRVRGMGEG